MPEINESALQQVSGEVHLGIDALADEELRRLTARYKRVVASRYVLVKPGEIEAKVREPELYVSTKIDGQLQFLRYSAEACYLCNYRGRVITGLPLLQTARECLQGEVDEVLVAGELYLPNEQDRPRSFHVTAALGPENPEAAPALAFCAFDIVRQDREEVDLPFGDTLARLQAWFPTTDRLHAVAPEKLPKGRLQERFEKAVHEQGEEGLVARSNDRLTYKIKPRYTVDAAIVGFTEHPEEEGRISDLLTALMRPDGSYQILSRVGTGFSYELRHDLLQELKPLAVDSDFKETDGHHTLFTMVRPLHVVQLAFHDVITDSASGEPISKAVLHFDPESGYQAQLPERFAAILAPVFERRREDKEVTPTDLRLTQLRDLVDLDNLERGARDATYAASEILDRQVYVKVTKKDNTMAVRKFLLWKTNKDELDPDFPAYVFCYTDYNPTRKDPLRRRVRVSSSEEQIRAIHAQFLQDEVKRGWEPFDHEVHT